MKIKRHRTIAKGVTFYFENKANALTIRDRGNIQAVTRFSLTYDDLPPLSITGFVIKIRNTSDFYKHTYNEGLYEDGDEIIEWYAKKTGNVDIGVITNTGLAKHNSIDLQKVVFNNCSYVRFQRKGGLNHNLRIISSLDLLSDTGITTVSISFKEG